MLAHVPLSHKNHSLSSSQNISTYLGFPWPIKERFMDHVMGYYEEHPYDVGLKLGIEEIWESVVSKSLCLLILGVECVEYILKEKPLKSMIWL